MPTGGRAGQLDGVDELDDDDELGAGVDDGFDASDDELFESLLESLDDPLVAVPAESPDDESDPLPADVFVALDLPRLSVL